MRITLPNNTERFGAVDIHEIQQVLELDSGLLSGDEEQAFGWQIVRHVPFDEINEIEKGMTIVVPVKGERLKVLEGVISGLPHDCLIILVSNSPREPLDRFAMERNAVEQFCRTVQWQAIIVHQRDPGIGRAFLAAGLPEPGGRRRHGAQRQRGADAAGSGVGQALRPSLGGLR